MGVGMVVRMLRVVHCDILAVRSYGLLRMERLLLLMRMLVVVIVGMRIL